MSPDLRPHDKRRLEVWRLRDGRRLAVIVQSDLLLHLRTRVVVPLLELGSFQEAEDINPILDVAGRQFVLASQAISSIRNTDLTLKVDELSRHETAVLRALDRLLTSSL